MATEATIRMNYNNAIRQAERLEEIANSYTNLAQKEFPQTMNSIGSHWKGDNASKYISKGNQLSSKMNNSAKQLKNTAAVIRKIAKNTYNAEMRNLQIAQDRTYN